MRNRKLYKVYETYTADYTGITEWAQRDDGRWFYRQRYRDPRYGWKWTRWTGTDIPPRDPTFKREMAVRLPKAA